MFFTTIKRILKSGFVNLFRNPLVSLSSVLIIVITLCVVFVVQFSSIILGAQLENLQSKVDVSVHISTSATESQINGLKAKLESLSEVASVQLVSKEEHILDFQEKHKGQSVLSALEEINIDEVLGAVLNVRAKDTSQYARIEEFLISEAEAQGDYRFIDRTNYSDMKGAADKLTEIIQNIKLAGTIVAIIFIAVSILITFNTIRLAIFTSKDEITIMQLVGAKSSFVRGPFVISGMFYGLIAWIIVFLILLAIIFWADKYTIGWFGGEDSLKTYFLSDIWRLTLSSLVYGILIGALASWIAVRKYLSI
jgi:cell division transport system permease protein